MEEQQISEVKDRVVEITEIEGEKIKKTNEDRLRKFGDNIKHTNIWIIEV